MGTTEYPHTTDEGKTVWACCVSSIGPACEHRRYNGSPAAALVLTALIVLALPLGIALARWLFAPEGDGTWAESDEDYGRRVMSPDYRGWRD